MENTIQLQITKGTPAYIRRLRHNGLLFLSTNGFKLLNILIEYYSFDTCVQIPFLEINEQFKMPLEEVKEAWDELILWRIVNHLKNNEYIFYRTSLENLISEEYLNLKGSKGEQKISQLLINNDALFEREKTFDTCRFQDTGYLARFDFYLLEENALIEYDGIQHFKCTNSGWNTQEHFLKTQQHDIIKNQWCKSNGISLIRIPYNHYKQLCIEDLMPITSHFIVT